MKTKHSCANRVLHGMGLLGSLGIIGLFACILFELYQGSRPSLYTFKWDFFTSDRWSPFENLFGGLTPIYGTFMTTVLAITLAIPLSFGISFFITIMAPQRLKSFLTLVIELLSLIPSIVFGLWGLLVFTPTLGLDITHGLSTLFQHHGFLSHFFSRGTVGINILSASIILTLMVLPFITVCFKNAFDMVPLLLKEAAYGLGCTSWEVMWRICVPYTRRQLLGGTLLGVTRALGETMAVAFVIGNSHRFTFSLLEPGSTIASVLANEFNEAEGSFYISSLVYLGFILTCMTVLTLMMSNILIRKKHHDT